MANKRLRNELVEGMQDLVDIGAVDKETMRTFRDDLLKPPPKRSADEIRKIREKAKVSQSVFAALMNVSVSTVQKWEQGERVPSRPAIKLLDIADHNGLNALIIE